MNGNSEKRLAAGLCEAEGWSGLDSPRCKKWRLAHEQERRKRRTGRNGRDSSVGEEGDGEEGGVMGDTEPSSANQQQGAGGSQGQGFFLPLGGDDSFVSMFEPATERPSAG